jgi:hypothetical protein
MVAGNALLSYSVVSQYNSVLNSGVEVAGKTADFMVMDSLFVSLTIISVFQLSLFLKLHSLKVTLV